MSNYLYKRVLLKLSGEALMGEGGFGIDPTVTERLATQVKALVDDGIQVGVVVGGGNIFRGPWLVQRRVWIAHRPTTWHACHHHERVGPSGCL